MREIKFRIVYNDGKMQHHSLEDIIASDYAYLLGLRKKGTEIMQFTGLLDKNGNEIYEGDVVKHLYPEGYVIATVQWTNRFGGWIVKNGHTDKNKMGWECKLSDEKTDTDLIIIGNIYENPELISPKH